MWIVGLNRPGYLPDNEPSEYEDFDSAKRALIEEILYHADFADDFARLPNNGRTPAQVRHLHDIAEALSALAEDVNLSSGEQEHTIETGDGHYCFFIMQAEDEPTLENHAHTFGPVESARFTGNPHRKCTFPFCKAVTLDLEDE